MSLDQVISALQQRKGTGAWRDIAKHAGVHYDTVARIARRKWENPSVGTVAKLSAAIRAVKVAKA